MAEKSITGAGAHASAAATDHIPATKPGVAGYLTPEQLKTYSSNAPTLVTPNLGTPSAGVLTNCTGTASGLTAGAVSTINGKIAQGSNVTLSGSGTDADPYTIASSGGASSVGKHTVWIPAGAMTPRTTNGASSGSVETSTNKVMIKSLDFDATTAEYAQFSIRMPKSWNEGTVTFVPVWSHAATTTNFGVVWSLAGVALSDGDAIDAAFGTAQTSTDTGGTTDTRYIGPESSAITIAGTPAAEDHVVFQVARVPSDASDTMAIDARLAGVTLYITTDAATDA